MQIEEFFNDFRSCLIAFQDPKVYGRSLLENSSFLVSSVCPDKRLHGTGFVARLSGSTSEFLEMWLLMNVGPQPFFVDDQGKLQFRLRPCLASWLFTEKDMHRLISFKNGKTINLFLPKNSYAFVFLGHTLVTYQNPKRKPTYGSRRSFIKRITFQDEKGILKMFTSDTLPAPYAEALREGRIQRLDVELG